MKLHLDKSEFNLLVSFVASDYHIPESAVRRDYFMTLVLGRLSRSEYASRCVFKGGTSLSKCYPETIERFSEDIDLTFLGMDLSDKACSKTIKKIESILSEGLETEAVANERSPRSKSMYLWYENPADKIKLEIGSNVKPDPYSSMTISSYIRDFLIDGGYFEEIEKYELDEFELNVLSITRTFTDKIMAVKRHALCGSLDKKVRHIYDVTMLFEQPEIQAFIGDVSELKRVISLTKQTDAYYLAKRNIPEGFDPLGPYDFEAWDFLFDDGIKHRYETLQEDLLYTDEKQDFGRAKETFMLISNILKKIGE